LGNVVVVVGAGTVVGTVTAGPWLYVTGAALTLAAGTTTVGLGTVSGGSAGAGGTTTGGSVVGVTGTVVAVVVVGTVVVVVGVVGMVVHDDGVGQGSVFTAPATPGDTSTAKAKTPATHSSFVLVNDMMSLLPVWLIVSNRAVARMSHRDNLTPTPLPQPNTRADQTSPHRDRYSTCDPGFHSLTAPPQWRM
jgi:hypothetical protein